MEDNGEVRRQEGRRKDKSMEERKEEWRERPRKGGSVRVKAILDESILF